MKEVIQRADELITKVKHDKEDLIDRGDGGEGDEDLPKTKTGTGGATYELRLEKTCLSDPKQARLYSLLRWLEA